MEEEDKDPVFNEKMLECVSCHTATTHIEQRWPIMAQWSLECVFTQRQPVGIFWVLTQRKEKSISHGMHLFSTSHVVSLTILMTQSLF